MADVAVSGTPVRDWLADAIRSGHNPECGACRSGARTCPEHAAEAVCEACRQERLFIMPQAEADGLYADVQRRAVTVALDRVTPGLVARERQQMAHEGTGYVPAWAELTDGEREESTAEAGFWLTAVRRAVLSEETK
jgi:hypothetical protein